MVKASFIYLCLAACVLAFFVVMLGAFTRLSDAGLGCPDWPGCYGHLIVPHIEQGASHVFKQYPNMPLHAQKAWTEMVHRYFAGTLGILIFILGGLSIRQSFVRKKLNILPLFLVGLVVFQALLGMWTVTLKLMPVIVMAHLLGGMTTLACLWWLFLRNSRFNTQEHSKNVRYLKPFALIALGIVACQILLGAWTSANYSALACLDFPTCQGSWFPHLNFIQAFNLFVPIELNHVGVLDNVARVTIHYTHRLGALLTTLYIMLFAMYLLRNQKNKIQQRITYMVLFILVCQISLGIMNVIFKLPLPIAVAHNGIAALLLLSILTLIYFLFKKNNKGVDYVECI